MPLITALTKFLHAVVDRFKKPPALEWDFVFIELDHPEFSFVRVPPEEHGLPCVKTMSPLGEIYVCAMPRGPRELPDFTAETYLCTEFEYQGKRGKFCSQPCLEPEIGFYKGVVFTTRRKGEEIEEIVEMTPFAVAAHSQIIAMKEFLREKDFEQKVGENMMKAFEANLRSFVEYNGLCLPENEKESNDFLRRAWEHVKSFLGEEKLARVGREQPYSCDTLIRRLTYPGFVRASGHSWDYFADIIKLPWNPEYDSREFADKYFELLKKYMEVPMDELTPWDIARVDEDFYYELEDIYYVVEDELYEELSRMSCEELAERGLVFEETCERMRRLEALLEEMSKHAPISGMEEEYEEARKQYKEELEKISRDIAWTIIDYAKEEADRIVGSYMDLTYSELVSKASEDWVASTIMRQMGKYCEERPYSCLQAYVAKKGGR